MPKLVQSPRRKSGSEKDGKLRTVRRPIKTSRSTSKRRKGPRMKILPPRHITKDEWAKRSPQELLAAQTKQKELTQNKTFTIESSKNNNITYTVRCNADGTWSCECGDYVFRHSALKCRYAFYCKHIAVCMDRFMNE